MIKEDVVEYVIFAVSILFQRTQMTLAAKSPGLVSDEIKAKPFVQAHTVNPFGIHLQADLLEKEIMQAHLFFFIIQHQKAFVATGEMKLVVL